MTTKVTRGQLMTFTAAPTDYLDDAVSPDSIILYLNYPHANGVSSTDTVTMEQQTDGSWVAEFDTADAEPGALFVSFRATNPAGAEDMKFSITANAANPDP